MRIRNRESLSNEDLEREISGGARLIYYPYTISLGIVTLKRKSDIYLVRKKENSVRNALPFLLISAFLGWWGIPEGPQLTLKSISVNRKGGKDITEEVMSIIAGKELFRQAEREKAI